VHDVYIANRGPRVNCSLKSLLLIIILVSKDKYVTDLNPEKST
jgi:hypothetical protein